MARLGRYFLPDQPLHVIQRGNNREAIFFAAEDYAREWRIGPFLSARLGSVVPAPEWYAAPRDEFPDGALAYRKLAGATPEWGVDPGAAQARPQQVDGADRKHARQLASRGRLDLAQRRFSARAIVEPDFDDDAALVAF